MKNSFKQIVIVGNVAVGKTTLMKSLEKLQNTTVLGADELFLTNPFFQLSKQDPKRWVFANDVWFLTKRVDMIASHQEKLRTSHLIIDSGLLMSYAYALAHLDNRSMSEEEFALYDSLFDLLCEGIKLPDLVVFLHAPTTVLRKRIEERNRVFEVQNYFEYLTSVNSATEKMIQKIKGMEIEVLSIDTTHLSPEAVAAEVVNAVG